VKYKKKRYKATLIYADKIRDLAQLSVPELNAPSITRKSYKKINVGEIVFAVGAPKGLALTLSQGLVSSIREEQDSVFIQTSSAISHGSSGGGLFDDEGQLIGITTAMVEDGQNLNFAVPADWIDDLKKRTLVSSPEEAKLLLLSGYYVEKGKIEKFLKTTTKWLELSPENYYALVLKADACLALRFFDTAIGIYKKVAKSTYEGVKPVALAASKGLAEAYIGLNRYHAAIKSYKKFVSDLNIYCRDSPNQSQLILIADSYQKMALCYEELKLYDKAISFHKKFEELISSSPLSQMHIGRLLRKKGKYRKAIASLKKAKDKAPPMAVEHIDYETARTYLLTHDFEKAISCFRTVTKNKELKGFAHAGLGDCYMYQKKYEKALKSYESALAINPEEIELYGRLGKLYLQRKEYVKAVTALERFTEFSKNDKKIWAYLAKAQMKAKQYTKATKNYERCTRLNGAVVNDWYYLALLHCKSKNFENAAFAFKKAIALKSGSASLNFQLGKVYVALNRGQEEQNQINKLKSLNKKAASELEKMAASRKLLEN